MSREFRVGWVENRGCNSCGSSLIKQRVHPVTGKPERYCVACGNGQWDPLPTEVQGLDEVEVREIMCREPGTVDQIIRRIHTPGHILHKLDSEERLIHVREFLKRNLSLYKNKALKLTENGTRPVDIKKITEAMEELLDD